MNTDNTEFLGTCAVCFTEHVVRDGVVVKHGWQECGGREVGVYGKAWHSGACFGVGHKPYEVSCEATKLFHEQCAVPHLLVCTKVVAHWRTRPVFTVTLTEWDRDEDGAFVYDGKGNRKTRSFHVECAPDNEFGQEIFGDYYFRQKNGNITQYDHYLGKRMTEAEQELNFAQAHVDFLADKIATWAPAEMREYHGKETVRHFQAVHAQRKSSVCGSRSYGVVVTTERSEVTCTRCLKSMASMDAYAAEKAKQNGDRETVIAFLRSQPKPVSGKEIRTALGFDMKRYNKAMDRSYNYGIESHWGKVETFSMKADA